MRNTRQLLFIHFLFRVAFYSFLTFKDIPVSMEFPALVLIFDCHLYYVANSVAQLRNEDLCANKYYTVYSKPGCTFFFLMTLPIPKGREDYLVACFIYIS